MRREQSAGRDEYKRKKGHKRNRRRGKKNGHAAMFERAPEKSRPAESLVGLDARLGQNLRNVDREFMRRRVHARVVAGAAVVAQIGKIKHVAALEIAPCFNSAKYGTIPLAVTARVADDQLPVGFLKYVKPGHSRPPLSRQAARTPSRWSGQNPRGSPSSEYSRT